MGTTVAMVQMNTRIDRDLKREGDRVLKAAGYSPSEAVRALWELACAHAQEPEVLRPLLSQTAKEEGEPFSELTGLWNHFVAEVGLSARLHDDLLTAQEEIERDEALESERLMAKYYGEGWEDAL